MPGFQVYGGSITGRVIGQTSDPVPNVVISIDGVNKTTTDRLGIYFVNFDKLPGKYTIEAKTQ